MKRARLIAFYLPQFHPTADNDAWWGKGFTEWTNVSKAKPLFPGHYQPHLPADLGFYDLRVPESREAQAELARNAGVEAFCYWHYWFAGRRVLERPFAEVVASGKPDFPFCLAWANDSWRSHWYGAEKRTLVEQTYPGPADHEAHFYAMLPAFKDRRYVRVHDKPMFTIFRPKNLPETPAFIDQWQKLAVKNGLKGIHFVAHLFDDELDFPWKDMGYGGAVVTNELKMLRRRLLQVAQERAKVSPVNPDGSVVSAAAGLFRLGAHRVLQRIFGWPGGVHYYKDAMLFFKSQAALDAGCYPSIVPGWDNTPRAGPKGIVLHGTTPELFSVHLKDIVASVASRPAEDRLVFVKSWNEWAEGNYLEPDRKFGHGYLDAVKAALNEPSGT
ncbi:MAG: glycoside hydrolase family 99-like domain-containing protein [Verrucomicrobia bacterium]|nr:glycoside hydrolase family 99-like domain-containing protein [Verrucomicrobiota bacterium]